MAQFKRYLIQVCLFSCVFVFSLYGQEAPEIRSFDFTVFRLNTAQPIEGVKFLNAQGKYEELAFNIKSRSQVYHYKGTLPLKFVRDTRRDAEGKVIYDTVANFQPISEGKCFLVFFMDNPLFDNTKLEGAPQYTLLSSDDSLTDFPYGSIRVFNACGAPLVGKIGKENLNLPTGPSIVYKKRSLLKSGFISFGFAVKIDQGYELVYKNSITFSEDTRSILVLRQPGKRQSLNLRSFLIEDSALKEDVEEVEGKPTLRSKVKK